ncbi:hypothetical protein [Actinophytocola sp.]|uniref:hypothetical protein n=1 Tax=Actinophytocola sp. TaxID=1872138 RepID=UPI002D7ED38E|nr:hypothetical protein [Actinophytocola sp.]HET9140818.1 hypothetical protein [Actinophytocola sp.]
MPADSELLVHLESLLTFADELERQLTSLADPAGRLDTLAGHEPAPGAFVEAASLVEDHRRVVAGMREALDQTRQAIGFAREVTVTVADGYRRSTNVAVDALLSLRRPR